MLERNKKKQWSSNYFADKEKSLKFVLSLLLAFFGKFLASLKLVIVLTTSAPALDITFIM